MIVLYTMIAGVCWAVGTNLMAQAANLHGHAETVFDRGSALAILAVVFLVAAGVRHVNAQGEGKP